MQRWKAALALFSASCVAGSAAAQDKRLALTVELGDVWLTYNWREMTRHKLEDY